MRVLLIFPPHCLPYQPWSVLPALTAYLRENDIDVIQRDLNIEIYHRFLSPGFLYGIGQRLERLLVALESKASLAPPEQARLLRTFRGYALSCDLPERIEAAKRTLKSSPEFYDYSALSTAREVISQAFEMISAAYHPSHLSHESFFAGNAHTSVGGLLEVTDDPAVSPFIHIYEALLPLLTEGAPPVIGISISLQEQVLPGLTLSRVLKQAVPSAKIVLGGFTLSKVAERIAKRPEFFDAFADYVVVGEGEKPLLALCRAIESGTELVSIPGVLHSRTGQLQAAAQGLCLDGNEQLTPDYDGLPLDLYLAPEPVLALAASRGCYWGRCAFCDRGRANGISYRPRSPAAVADDLELLSRRHGARNFTFTDDAISPGMLGRIATEIAARSLDIHLSVDCRFDPGFTRELCRKIGDAGFVHLRFGLESASDRVLGHMGKGTTRERVEVTLRNLAHERVCTHLYVFFGFPTESPAEADETIGFVTKHRNSISCACCTTFGLLEGTPALMNPEEFGITAVDRAPDRLFKYFFDWKAPTGPSRDEARQRVAEFFAAMEREYEDFWVLGHLEWGHQFLYCSRYGFKSGALRHPTAIESDATPPLQTGISEFIPMLEASTIYHESRYDIVDVAERLRGTNFPDADKVPNLMPKPTKVLYNPRNSRMLALNDHATEILGLIDSATSAAQITAVLSKRYSLPEAALEGAVSTFIEELQRNGMLRAERCPAGKQLLQEPFPGVQLRAEEASCH